MLRASLGLRNLHILSRAEHFSWRALLLYLEVRYFLHYSGISSSLGALRSTDSYFCELGMWYDTLNQVRNTEIVPYLLQFITNQVCRLKETSLRLKTNGFFKGGDRKDSTNVLSVLLLIPRISQEVSLRDLKGQLTKQKLVSGSDLFLLRLDQLRYRLS